jgi:hypothetical protein
MAKPLNRSLNSSTPDHLPMRFFRQVKAAMASSAGCIQNEKQAALKI